MASFTITSVTDTTATIRITPSSGYGWYRLFVRLTTGASTAHADTWMQLSGTASSTVRNLSPGTSYTVNVAYSTTQNGADTTWIGAQTFTTTGSSGGGGGGGGSDSVRMYIDLGDGIYGVAVRYYTPDGGTDSYTFTSNGYVDVMPNTVQSVTYISLESGYDHPVTCYGTSSWEMTNSSGSFIDATLQMGSSDKTFSFTAKQTATGGVRINGQNYTPYIYTGSWNTYGPYVYTGSWRKSGG